MHRQFLARRLALRCALILAALVPMLTARTATASFARSNGRIVFTGCSATGCDIYTVNPDGTAMQQVTHNGSSFTPDWSPDGSHIAYASSASGAVALWIADTAGGNARQLTPNDPNSANLWPRFMPDGLTILYTNCFGEGCDGGISAVNVDGSGQRAITPNSGESYNLAVPSPDGKQIAFMRWHVHGIMMGIYVLRLGTTLEQPVTLPELEGWAPDWAPDGSRILFSSDIFANRPGGAIYSVRTGSNDLRIAEDDAGPDRAHANDLRQLTYPPFPLEDWSAAYAPDGTRIVFTSDRHHPDRCCGDLYLMRSDGSQIGQIQLSLPSASDPRWGVAPLQPAAGAGVADPQAIEAIRRVCNVVPVLAQTPLCHGAGLQAPGSPGRRRARR